MKQRYKVLEPFDLKGFRPVVEGELITLHPNVAIAYDLIDSLEEVKPSQPPPELVELTQPESE